MPRSKEDDAARKREARVMQPTNEAKRKLPRSKEDDAARKREERSVALRAQAAAKQTAQDVVQPTNDAERKRRERQDAAQAQMQNKTHGGSREHAGRPRELSR